MKKVFTGNLLGLIFVLLLGACSGDNSTTINIEGCFFDSLACSWMCMTNTSNIFCASAKFHSRHNLCN